MKKLALFLLIYWCLTIPVTMQLYFNHKNQEISSIKAVQSNTNKFSLNISSGTMVTVTISPIASIEPSNTPIVSLPTETPIPTVKPTQTPKETIRKTKTSIVDIDISQSVTYSVSAYDLSVESCGLSRNQSGFGKTCSGYSLIGQTRESAMTIAADLSILPLGTKVSIKFYRESMQEYNGIYTVRDTGGAIRGHKLDLFMGDDAHQEADNFGVQKAYVSVIN